MLCQTLITIRLLVYLSCFQTVECAAPSFTVPVSATAAGSVDENSAKDVSILTVEGEDTDGDTLTFSLVSQTPTSPPFFLDSSTGLLKTPAGLDAEFSLTYNFTFGVSDSVTTVNSVTFTLNINDINEPPVFQGTPYSASLLDSVSNGFQVFDANATDPDATATVTYNLTSGNSPVTFSLNSTNGLITVSDSTQLDPTSTPSYSLTIQASDGTLTVIVTVSITVNDDPCNNNPCENGGTCVTSGTSYTCTCASGFTGTNCTITSPSTFTSPSTSTSTISNTADNDDSCNNTNNPCVNGGTCVTSGTSYTCTCASGFTGTNCTIISLSTSTSSSTADNGTDEPYANIGLKVGLIVLVVSVIVLVAVAVKFRKKINCLRARKISCSSQPIDQHHPKRSATEESDIIRKNKIPSTDTTSTSGKKLLCTYTICCFTHHPKRSATEGTDIIREHSIPPTDTTSTNTSGKKLSYNNWIMEGKTTGDNYQNNEIPCSPEPINQPNPRTTPTEETVTICENSMPPTDTKSKKRRRKKKISTTIDNRSSTDPLNDLNNQIGLNSKIETNWNTERKTTGDNYQNNEIPCSPEPINQHNPRTTPTEETVTICENSMPPTDTKSKKRRRKKKMSTTIDNRSSTDPLNDLNNQIGLNSKIETNWNTERKTTGDNYQNNEIPCSPEPINQHNPRTTPTEETVTICENSMPPTDTKSKKRRRKKRVSAKIDNRSSTDPLNDLNNQFIDLNSNIEI